MADGAATTTDRTRPRTVPTHLEGGTTPATQPSEEGLREAAVRWCDVRPGDVAETDPDTGRLISPFHDDPRRAGRSRLARTLGEADTLLDAGTAATRALLPALHARRARTDTEALHVRVRFTADRHVVWHPSGLHPVAALAVPPDQRLGTPKRLAVSDLARAKLGDVADLDELVDLVNLPLIVDIPGGRDSFELVEQTLHLVRQYNAPVTYLSPDPLVCGLLASVSQAAGLSADPNYPQAGDGTVERGDLDVSLLATARPTWVHAPSPVPGDAIRQLAGQLPVLTTRLT